MMLASRVVLPGDLLDATQVPTSAKRKVGRGLRASPNGDTITSIVGGLLEVDQRKKTAAIGTPDARYVPKVGDLVIAQVRGSSMDTFHLYINAHSPQAILSHLAFEGASKKTRPQLKPNDLVYAKVVSAQKNMEIELSCVNPSTGKSEPDGLGPLTAGMVFDVSPGFAERLLKRKGVVALDELGSTLPGGFELAVGVNGRVWVDCPGGNVKIICAVGRCLREMDLLELGEKDQKRLVSKITAELGVV